MSSQIRIVTCLITTLFFCIYANGQIVNTENQRMQSDTVGWMGSFGTTFSLEKTSQRVININTTAHVQYKTERNLYLILANYTLLRGSGETFSNNVFLHLRYNRKINKWLRWEVFTQVQQNNVTGIQVRYLAGTGPRFKIYGAPKFSLYAGTAAMYEYEKEQTKPPVYHNDIRSSNYVSLTYKPNDIFELITTTFYQPLFRRIKDYRVLNEISLKMKVFKHLSFTTNWSYLYDEFPAGTTPQINYTLGSGVLYEF